MLPRMGWTIEAVGESPAEPHAVFARYADPDTWNTWGHNATWARSDGPLVEGGTVHVRANYGKVYPCLVRRLEPDRALELIVRPPGMTIVNGYEVEPLPGGGSRIRHSFAIEGPMGTLARLIGLRRVYTRKLEAEVRAVARLAEGEDAPGNPSTPVTPAERALHGAERTLGIGEWED
jgi:hypothetical protein